MITALNAIPMKVPSQIDLKNFIASFCTGDMLTGVRLGVFLCHFGELLRRREGDCDVSNAGISNEEFESKMANLLNDVPDDVLDYILGYSGE